MARINPLHIDIPSAPTHLLLHNKKTSGPHSPGVFDDATTTRTKDNEASFFSLTRNGSHYPDSPSSDISSPMMTPLPFKMMMDSSLPLPLPPMAVEKDDRKKLREYEFPSSVAIKVEGMPAYHQSYQNHPFTQLRQPRQQQQQQQNQQLSTPPAAKAMTPAQLSYSAKYANFTTNSTTTTTTTITPQQQPVVRVSPRPTHIHKDNTNSRKPSTTMALSMIEKEKMAYQYPSHRVSMVSPPPPPYISASPSPSSTDHGAGVGVGANTTTTTTTNTQSAVTAAAIIAIAPPLQQVPDQQLQQLPYDPAILTPASLAALTQNKRHSYPVGLARSASSSSSFSSPAIIIAGSGATMMSDNGVATSVPRVISPKSTFPRDTKRHSVAGIPSSSSAMTMSTPVGLPRHKLISHRGSNMPPQAIPIYSSTGSSAATTEMMMTMMMKTPPTAFNPRSSLSSTRLLESLKHASSSSASSDSDGMGMAEKDLSALIGPEDDHKNPLPMLLSQANIHHHNMTTSSSPPRTQQQGLLRIASLQRATAAASAAERNLIMSTSRIGGGGGSATTGGGPIERNAEFPGYWEDARQHRMHWTVYSIGLATIGSLVWVLMMPALMVWAPILPGVVVLLMGVQYSTYRWRRRRHYKQQLKDRRPSPAALSSMRAASAALTHSRSSSAVATAPSSPQFHAFSPNHHHLYNNHNHARGISIGGLVGNAAIAGGGMGHAYKSSLSSMHTSVGSITTSDSFLEPHHPLSSTTSPPHHLRSQFQHQYYRQPGMGSVTSSSSTTGSPPRFSEAYPDSTLPPSATTPSPPTSLSRQAAPNYQIPSPEYRRSWFSAFRTPVNTNTNTNSSDTKNGSSGRWERTIQRRESSSSASSIASSETVSSSSTDSGADSPSATRAPPAMTGSPSGSFSSIPMTSSPSPGDISKMHKLSSGDLSTITMLPPPPAYVSRKYEDLTLDMAKAMMVGVHEKGQLKMDEKNITMLGLPEIAPLGDLMSEFAVDFGAILY